MQTNLYKEPDSHYLHLTNPCKLKKGAKHFTKLDLRPAFHQLELDEESRYTTALRAEKKVKQYKTLYIWCEKCA